MGGHGHRPVVGDFVGRAAVDGGEGGGLVLRHAVGLGLASSSAAAAASAGLGEGKAGLGSKDSGFGTEAGLGRQRWGYNST